MNAIIFFLSNFQLAFSKNEHKDGEEKISSRFDPVLTLEESLFVKKH
jgi:hypothetical protein